MNASKGTLFAGRMKTALFAAVAFGSTLTALLSGCTQSIETPDNRYALVIGVEDYPADTSDLSYSVDDADAMATRLASKGWTVTKLVDAAATNADIRAAIAGLSDDSGATILVYYSGHGSEDDNGTPCIIPYDGLVDAGYKFWNTDSETWEEVARYTTESQANWITPATMTSWLGDVSAKNRMLILDSCYSGGFSLSDASVDTSPADYSWLNGDTSDTSLIAAALSNFSSLVANNLSSYGDKEVLTIAAAGSEEESMESSAYGNGVFTYYLLEAADEGDSDGDRYVTASEAYVYAKKMLKANWNSISQIKFGDEDFLPHISGGTGDIVLYVN